MTFCKRLLNLVLLFALSNILLILNLLNLHPLSNTVIIAALLSLFISFNIRPRRVPVSSRRMRAMTGGYELLITSAIGFSAEILFYLLLCFVWGAPASLLILLLNGGISLLVLGIPAGNGLIRLFATSAQLGIAWRILLLTLWWFPVLNLFLLYRCCKLVRREILFEAVRGERNDARREKTICMTKYPVVLVHGIFFRDWQFLNYWGRIPKELIRNGASVYYGKQQSASSVVRSAGELKQQIMSILSETGCEKVHIIAHSKGGLDARYMISRLGMQARVASLTTINTPHRGCDFVDRILKKIPAGFVKRIAAKYNSAFQKLGDRDPDFIGGINDLTAERCETFNRETPDVQGVLYQSAASRMSSPLSAGFPLNLGYLVIRPIDGPSDGLVTPASAEWGNFLGTLRGTKRKGISHGDMIDLTRKNIPGFDVCEFYVDIVKKLKDRGL